MPLMPGKSKKAFSKNAESEMNAGKSQPQSLAIAYSVQRKNKRKMANGGAVASSPSTSVAPNKDASLEGQAQIALDHEHDEECLAKGGMCYAEGGAVSAADEKRPIPSEQDNDADMDARQKKMANKAPGWMDVDSHQAQGSKSAMQRGPDFASEDEANIDAEADSIADAIIRKRRRAKMMAEGGEVDLEANSEESPNFEDDASFEANGKEQYDDGQISPQPRDSNLHSDDISSDEHDMIDKIRAKIRAKRGM